MLSSILTGIGAIGGAIGTLQQNKLNKKALKQRQKQFEKAEKYNKKAIKLAKDIPEYDPITGTEIDSILEQNITFSDRALRQLEPTVSRENVFNIEEARRTNQYIREELARFLPGYEQLQQSMSEVIASNLAGDLTAAEKAALLEDIRTAAANRGVTGGVEDTANLLAFFDRRRQMMNIGVAQNMQAVQLAKSISYEPPTALRRQFTELGAITAAQRLGTEQTERLNQYNSRVNAIKMQIAALQGAANSVLGSAAQIQAPTSPLAALAPLLQGFSDIISGIEMRRMEQRRYQDVLDLRRRELDILERAYRRFL